MRLCIRFLPILLASSKRQWTNIWKTVAAYLSRRDAEAKRSASEKQPNLHRLADQEAEEDVGEEKGPAEVSDD